MKQFLCTLSLAILLIQISSAINVVSINNGGSTVAALTPNRQIEGFFLGQALVIVTAPPVSDGRLPPKEKGFLEDQYLLLIIILLATAAALFVAYDQQRRRRNKKKGNIA